MSRAVLLVGSGPKARELVDHARRRGTTIREGWPAGMDRTLAGALCTGTVRDAADAVGALLAAVAGADIVVEVPAWSNAIDRLVDDLRRVSDVEVGSAAASEPLLAPDDLAILDLYAGGLRRIEVARAIHLSPRSLDRRVAGIKQRLGARTLAQAIEAARRL